MGLLNEPFKKEPFTIIVAFNGNQLNVIKSFLREIKGKITALKSI